MRVSLAPAQADTRVRTNGLNHDRSRRLGLLIWEGAYANLFIIMTGGAFLTGLAILLGANDFELGILAAVPFAMQSAQLISAFLFPDPASARLRLARTLATGRILWLGIIPLLFFDGAWRLYVLIAIEVISSLLLMASAPAWLAWMADVVPRRIRGRFFSRRNAAVAATTVIGTIAASLVIDWARWLEHDEYGFISILLIAALGGLLAWRAMAKISDVPASYEEPRRPAIDKLAPFRDRTFRRVLIVFGAWNISVGISAAFFAPQMLLNLKMSFFQVGLYSCGAATAAIASSRVWGKLIDRFGSKPMLNICAFGISLIPLIWLFPNEKTTWILIPEALYSGLLWAGFNLAAFTLPLDRSPRTNRTVYLSVFATVTGLAFFAASIVGGYIAELLGHWSIVIAGFHLVNYHLLFAISSLLRLSTAGLMAALHEPAEVRLPVVIQLMGYAVLKRISIGRQLFPFAAEANEVSDTHTSGVQ